MDPAYTSTVESASAVPVKVGVVILVMPSVDDGPVSVAAVRVGAAGALGATVSMRTVWVLVPLCRPAVSVA